jgi:tRNA(fMet)-specific endonuclease VapC
VSYLLDTNACIAIINCKPAAVRYRFRETAPGAQGISISTVALFELWYGVAKSARSEANAERLAIFLAVPEILPFDDADARAAGTIRAGLERSGTPIGAYDTLIAGQALCRGLILVTANIAEFDRVPGLKWEDWSKPHP